MRGIRQNDEKKEKSEIYSNVLSTRMRELRHSGEGKEHNAAGNKAE